MNKAVSGIMLSLLILTSMLTLAFNIKPTKAEWSGTVHIRADGSIDPPTAPITTYDFVTYALTDNIKSSADGIVVARNNTIIDGAGYILQGSGISDSKGIDISGAHNVTVKNATIQNFWFGIHICSSRNSITENKITNNYFGIYICSSNNSVYRNIIANNKYGISIFGGDYIGSENNSIYENDIKYNDCGISLEVWAWESSSIFHNNFIKNVVQVSNTGTTNVWDDGYPSGGNYWSDYTGYDADRDCIGDTPYVIDTQNIDHYPLMYAFMIPVAGVWTDKLVYYVGDVITIHINPTPLFGAGFYLIINVPDGTKLRYDFYPYEDTITTLANYSTGQYKVELWRIIVYPEAIPELLAYCFFEVKEPTVRFCGIVEMVDASPTEPSKGPGDWEIKTVEVFEGDNFIKPDDKVWVIYRPFVEGIKIDAVEKGDTVEVYGRYNIEHNKVELIHNSHYLKKSEITKYVLHVVDEQKTYDVGMYLRDGEDVRILDLIDKSSLEQKYFPGVSVPLYLNRWTSILKVEVSLDGRPVVDEEELNRVLQAVSGWVMAKYTVDNSGALASSFEIMNDFTKNKDAPEGVAVKIIDMKSFVLGLPNYVACPQAILDFGIWQDAVTSSIERSFLEVMAPEDAKVAEWVDEIVGNIDPQLVSAEVKHVVAYLVKASLLRVEGAELLSFLSDYATEKGGALDPEFVQGLNTVISTYGVSNYEQILKNAIHDAVVGAIKECVKLNAEEILNRALKKLIQQLAEEVSPQFAAAFSSIVSGVALGYLIADAVMKPCENFRLATSFVASMYVAREYGKMEKALMNDLASNKNIDLKKAYALINLRKIELHAMGQSYELLSQIGDVSLFNQLLSKVGVWLGYTPTKKQILEAADIFLYPSKNIEQVTPLLVDKALGRSHYWIEPTGLSTYLFRGEQQKLSVKITPQTTIDTQDFETLFLHENSPTVSIEKVEYSNGAANVTLQFSVPDNADFGLYQALALLKTKDETKRTFTLFLSINVLPDNMLRVEILSPVPNERREVIGGEDLKISARVTLKEGSEVKPAENADVTAYITASKMAGSTFSSSKMDYAGEGIYETTLNSEEFCAYTINVIAEKRGQSFIFIPIQLYIPGSASIEFVVIPKSALTITLKETQHKLYLHIYDSQNRHVGINYETNEIEVQIPGASYHDFNDGTTLVTLPDNLTSFRYLVDAEYATLPSESFNISIINYKDGVAISSLNESRQIKQAQQYTKNIQILSDGKIQVEGNAEQNWLWPAIISMIAILSAITITILINKKRKKLHKSTPNYQIQANDMDLIEFNPVLYRTKKIV
jgi:parallel beta-helix repeat protein